MSHASRYTLSAFFLILVGLEVPIVGADGPPPMTWRLTQQVETSEGSRRFHRIQRPESWRGEETAIIVCDMWDSHHGLNAARRVAELAPAIDRFLAAARPKGVTIVHAPSSCMAFYAEHPARRRAASVPRAASLPEAIDSWCHQIPVEKDAPYPIDQSDGGEDDDPIEHRQWHDQLKSQGRDPKRPWRRQMASIRIDGDRDYISDSGSEIWSILQQRKIRHVLLVGVHTNMCVLGRPFGLRQLARNGMQVALVRDLTDTMYNPASRPFVNHFSGTDLIIDYIERYICPTVVSSELVGGAPFKFQHDRRKHLVIVMAEDEYDTRHSLPAFADRYLRKNYRVSLVFGSDSERHMIPGLTWIDDADVVLVSVRRRALPKDQMDWFRRHVAQGKGIVGIRTASHAFHLRDKPTPDGLVQWRKFDADVLGGNYHNHHGNKRTATVRWIDGARTHAILHGVDESAFAAGGSLYKTAPLKPGAFVLAMGEVADAPPEPVAWTFVRADGGRSFYTALGHVKDFENRAFVRMLVQGIDWTAARLVTPGSGSAPAAE